MKKSEMEKLIKECLEESALAANCSCDCYKLRALVKKTSEDLLELILNSGMLPPTMRLDNFGVNDNTWETEDD